MAEHARNLRPGDVVTLESDRFPKCTFRAAVAGIGPENFGVFSTELASYKPSEEDVTFGMDGDDYRIVSVTPASEAIPEESGGFQQGERIRTEVTRQGGPAEGIVVAAHNGYVHAWTDDGQGLTGLVDFFKSVDK